MVCLKNICINTLHEGDNYDDDDGNNNNNNKKKKKNDDYDNNNNNNVHEGLDVFPVP